LLNLLSNAVKFTSRGQVKLRLRLTSSSRLRFEVQDTGVGIPQDQLEMIFQPFEQAGDTQRRLGGTGLGLTISRQLAHLMNSEIMVESHVGQGSTFWFELEAPVVQAASLPAPMLTEAAVSGYEGARKTILVVDDVAENRQVAADMLCPLGFTVTEAANGREGLEKAQALQPDLILMDIVMPEMDGLETMCRLRQGGKEVPVIAISASASGDTEADSLAAGANAFLPKPVELGRLLTQIGALLKLSWTYEQPGAWTPEPVVPELLPAQEMETLYRLARLGNMREIVQWATQLGGRDERYRPFAAKLCKLANNYQSQAILNLAEQCLKEKGIH